MSSSTVIACSGYNTQNNEFIFISKNSDRNDYHLNSVRSTNQTTANTQPLSGMNGYPRGNSSSFNGLCSYTSKNASMYLSFESVISSGFNNSTKLSSAAIYNTTISSIYQLQFNGNGSYRLNKTPIVLYNTTLFSFVYITDTNDTSNLAYIATNTNDPNTATLNLQSFESPNSHFTSKNITGTGILAAGGNNSQSLYVIRSNLIEEYRLDTMDYSQSSFETNISINNLKPGTTGQVLSVINQNFSSEYISVYYPESAEIDIFNHDLSLSNYTPLPPMVNGYISFINNTTENNNSTNKGNNNSSSSSHGGTTLTAIGSYASLNTSGATTSISAASSMYSNTKSHHHAPSKPTALLTDPSANNKKRGLANGNPVSSLSDGAYTYSRANITSENGSPLPAAAGLIAAYSLSQTPPYSIVSLSGNDSSYSINIMTGSGNSIVVDGSSSPSPEELGDGAIAGIFIGILAFIAIVSGLLFYTKKRKNDENDPKLRSYNSMPLSIQPNDFVSPFMVNRSMNNNYKDNHSNTSSILQESKYIPEEYHDGSRPDIRPLSYSADTIDYAQPSSDELLKLEPDVEGPLFLFSGLYTSSTDEMVTYLKDGYAIRTFDSGDGNKHTIHYFSSANLDTFVRSVYAVLKTSSADINDKHVMKSERAIILGTPTPNFNYQYIWITSPMIPEHSLYHLLFERKKWTFVDHHNMDYKIWSVYAILKSIETIQSLKFVHLAIDLKSYYYDHEMKATDWRLGNFSHAQPLFSLKNNNILLPSSHSSFTAPEIIVQKYNNDLLEKADIWSAGCVIYTIATGGKLLFENDIQVKNLVTFNNDMKQHLKIAIRDNIDNKIFKNILEKLLRVDPNERQSIIEVLDYWNSIYNMEA